jgi:catechol 2,3-dioxygenase-like lactoylglutathione lyase family enzyme
VEISKTPPTRGIRHVALFVKDLSRAERFYVEILGYAVEWRPDAYDLYLTRGEDNLALHGPRSTTAEVATDAPRESALDHFGLLCDRAEDVEAWAAHLASRGVALDTKPRKHRDGATSFYFRDPDGNRIQIIHHPPIAGK